MAKNNPVETAQLQKDYLDLMEKVLSFSLWSEPSKPIAEIGELKAKHALLKPLDWVLSLVGAQIALPYTAGALERENGRIWPSQGHTMIGLPRLRNTRMAVETALREDIPGDLIETGVWRGGNCIYMRAILRAYGDTKRKVVVADSFEGLPPPNEAEFPADAKDRLHTFSDLAISMEQVQENFAKYGLLDDQVQFLKGFFKDTLGTLRQEAFAVIRLDGDMYESTIQALDALYPKLSGGGFCIIDDYALQNCAKAVEDYRRDHGIKDEMHTIDWTGRYWRKSVA